MDSYGFAVFNHISYNLDVHGDPILGGNYQINFYLADGKIRACFAGSRALSSWFQLYDMIGNWFLRTDRLIVINSHTTNGFAVNITNETGNIFGTIEGTLGFNLVVPTYFYCLPLISEFISKFFIKKNFFSILKRPNPIIKLIIFLFELNN
jgi:hypothetical protein